MNKSEFLKALSKQIKLLPKDDREDALTFYNEYLEDYGFAENEDVTAKLGTPKEVAKNMIAEITMKHIDSNEEKKSAKKTAVIVWIAIISIFSLPISLPIALCLLIIVFALFITLLILFIALVGAGLIVITAGAGVFLSGIIAPGIGQKLVCFGGGMLVTAIGMALCFLTVIVYILLIRLAVQIIKKSAEKKVKKA